MRFEEIELGNSRLVDRFLSELETNSDQLLSVFLVSPYVELSTGSKVARRLTTCLTQAKKSYARVALISDRTPHRQADFQRAVMGTPDLDGVLHLSAKLHAKCGLATLRSGFQFGFLGSANLTEPGLFQNRELVLGLVNHGTGSADCQLCSDLEQWIQHTLITSQPITQNN